MVIYGLQEARGLIRWPTVMMELDGMIFRIPLEPRAMPWPGVDPSGLREAQILLATPSYIVMMALTGPEQMGPIYLQIVMLWRGKMDRG